MLANDPNLTSIIAIIKSLYGEERSEQVEREVEELIDNILKWMQNKKEKIIIDPSNYVHTMMVNEEKIRKETTFLDRRGHDRPYTVNPKTCRSELHF